MVSGNRGFASPEARLQPRPPQAIAVSGPRLADRRWKRLYSRIRKTSDASPPRRWGATDVAGGGARLSPVASDSC